MPVSGRRHQALQQQAAEQRADILRLERELTDTAAERDTALAALAGLRTRQSELTGRDLTAGEAVLARQLRYSEDARKALAAQIEILQTANEGAAREGYDRARGVTA